jgi:hypothetical protein
MAMLLLFVSCFLRSPAAVRGAGGLYSSTVASFIALSPSCYKHQMFSRTKKGTTTQAIILEAEHHNISHENFNLRSKPLTLHHATSALYKHPKTNWRKRYIKK